MYTLLFLPGHHPDNTGDGLPCSPIISSNISAADGKGAVSGRRFFQIDGA